eukprot:TRINITY_DN10597_c0_g1_i5.p1 TRINITY_DN10597_c0_g1~~TRINITY_DN10597_c0_g1_i5.p1  ORF type:complete len:224 (-),score=65.56 TRINITY_DN10597_c0_g1_i5:45-716(-)
MGSCCSSKERNQNVDSREQKLDLLEEFAKKGNKLSEAENASVQEEPIKKEPEEVFREEVKKLESTNSVVREKRKELGDYDFGEPMSDEVERILKEMQVLDNEREYYGFWNKETNELDGKGMILYPDGSQYEGYLKNNEANGKGRLIHADGDVYIGEWVDDKANGKGKYIHADGTVYEGQWVDDKQDGRGVEEWKDGSRYEGEYKNGKKSVSYTHLTLPTIYSV